jgi:DNA mismatch repair protein MutL
VRSIGLPRGCSVDVGRLFFNTPARRKFLRTENTELSHCMRWLTRYALAHPRLRLHLLHGERRLLDLAPADDLRERITQIHGARFAEKLLPFEGARGQVQVAGLAGRPVDSQPRRDAQHFIVNGRAVQDRVLAHAVGQGYQNTMAPGRHPTLFLTIELPAEAVDVNVHPQKTEVRFRDGALVHDLVRDTLLRALGRQGSVPDLGDLRPAAVSSPATAIREATLGYLEGRLPRSASVADTARRQGGPSTRAPATPAERGEQPPVAAPSLVERERRAGGAVPLAQFRDSYIVAEEADGLILVDQHAAHERVLFERYLSEAERNEVEVQRLLYPVTVELAPHQRISLEEELEAFARLGFLVEPFGSDAVRLDGVPAIAVDVDPETLFRELLGQAQSSSAAATDVARARLKLVTTAACKAAIKVRHNLTDGAMQRLLDDLFACTNPTTCPHGRPILFRLSLDEIERAFRRR